MTIPRPLHSGHAPVEFLENHDDPSPRERPAAANTERTSSDTPSTVSCGAPTAPKWQLADDREFRVLGSKIVGDQG